jgi:glutaminyl-peptide cyclotransferase
LDRDTKIDVQGHRFGLTVMVTIVMVTASCSLAGEATGSPDVVPVIQPTILAEIPHAPDAYTEGLELDGGALYEATGMWGESELRELDPGTGALRRAVALPSNYFGEGITVVGDRIWQLTYQGGVAFEWDKSTFAVLRTTPVDGDGWGLCLDGNRLIRSDGSDRLRFHETADFTETGSVTVTRDGSPVTGLDELECVAGQVWANVWPTDEFVRIDPATGRVNLAIDASNLWRGGPRTNEQAMSSIAHISGDEYLIVGKKWPWSLRVRIGPAS